MQKEEWHLNAKRIEKDIYIANFSCGFVYEMPSFISHSVYTENGDRKYSEQWKLYSCLELQDKCCA